MPRPWPLADIKKRDWLNRPLVVDSFRRPVRAPLVTPGGRPLIDHLSSLSHLSGGLCRSWAYLYRLSGGLGWASHLLPHVYRTTDLEQAIAIMQVNKDVIKVFRNLAVKSSSREDCEIIQRDRDTTQKPRSKIGRKSCATVRRFHPHLLFVRHTSSGTRSHEPSPAPTTQHHPRAPPACSYVSFAHESNQLSQCSRTTGA